MTALLVVSRESTRATRRPTDAYHLTVLDLADGILRRYVALAEHEYAAIAGWIIHARVFDRFMVTLRLLATSPVRSCGKTTLLDVLERLVASAYKSDSITAAAICHAVNTLRATLLVDEADNLDLSASHVLRAVLNSGHRRAAASIVCSVDAYRNSLPSRPGWA